MSLRRLLSSEIASIVRSGRTLRPRFEETRWRWDLVVAGGTDYSVPRRTGERACWEQQLATRQDHGSGISS